MTAWKTRALTVFRLWHLVRENAICIRHKSNLFPVDWCLCVRVCVPDCVCSCLSACGCVCVHAAQRKVRVSVGSVGAGLAHRQTNTLHYRPIYLINRATLSTAQHSAMHGYQQHPGSTEAPSPPHSVSTQTQTRAEFANTQPDFPTDCFSNAEWSPRAWVPTSRQSQWTTSNTPPCRPELTSPITS